MSYRLGRVCCWVLVLSAAALGRALSPDQHRADACSLLTSSEIKAVQGEGVKETKPTRQPGSGIVVSQCVLVTPTPAKSVSVMLTAPDPSNPSSTAARDWWRKQFASANTPEEKKPKSGKAQKSEEEGEHEGRRPQSIKGLGEQAFWMGTRVGGALYVLRGNSFARISVGGEKSESVRIQKSKTLARALLKRM